MTPLLPDMVFGLAVPMLCLALGLALGGMYFASLWWSVNRLVDGGRAWRAGATGLARLVLLGGALALASLHGAQPLLATLVGVLVGRALVMHWVKVRAA